MNDKVDDEQIEENEPSKIANMSVAEKVVICIDKQLLRPQSHQKLMTLLRQFRKMKETIAVKPVEFSYIIFDKEVKYLEIHSERVFEATLQTNVEEGDETQPCDLGLIFQTLVERFKIPDPSFFNRETPPPFVIHVVLIFGRSLFMPKLSEPNCFLFFAKNLFFTLDVLHLHNGSQEIRVLKISEALKIVAKTCSGYFFCIGRNKFSDIQSTLTEFLGHPLIRYPQDSAVFKIDIRGNDSV